MMSEGCKNKDIAEATGYHEAYHKKLVSKYRKGGMGALTDNHYPGNHLACRKISNGFYSSIHPGNESDGTNMERATEARL